MLYNIKCKHNTTTLQEEIICLTDMANSKRINLLAPKNLHCIAHFGTRDVPRG